MDWRSRQTREAKRRLGEAEPVWHWSKSVPADVANSWKFFGSVWVDIMNRLEAAPLV